jgi:hypothetical protein
VTAHVRKITARPREKDDFYKTPPAAVRALLAAETFAPVIHEPACGDGAISEVLEAAGHEVFSSDLVHRGFGEGGVDFLLEQCRPCDCLVTNPPFSLADEFALHAQLLGYKHVALLMRLSWLEGGARRKRLWVPHPPTRIWVFSKRQTLWRGDEAPGKNGGAVAFAWFVWRAGQHGTQVGWLP